MPPLRSRVAHHSRCEPSLAHYSLAVERTQAAHGCWPSAKTSSLALGVE